MTQSLTGFILAAGFGTRLKPLTDHIPKALVPVCGKPLLKRALDFCSGQGISRIGVNSFHFPDQMRAYREKSEIGFSLFQETGAIRGTGGAFHFARDFLSQTDYFFACNVDILAHVDIASLFDKFQSSDSCAGLVAIPLESGGSILYDNETKEYRGAKSDPGVSGGCAEFLGMAFYRRDFLPVLRPDDFSVLPIWKRAQAEGLGVKVIEVGAPYWKDAGTPKALAGVHFDLFEKKYLFSLPSDITVDYVGKRAYPARFSPDEIARLGPNVWCEAASIPEEAFIESSVVFRDAALTAGKIVKNAIVTPWGEMGF
jgi:NDP-sugar pyrophosphorylase family protein